MYKKIYYILILFAFIAALFIVENNVFAITPESDELYNGIDVSGWQGYIDYSNVKNAGIDIVYIKAIEGSRTKDPYFELNYENAKANGLNVGFYHYLTATNERGCKRRSTIFCFCNSR